MNIDQIAAEAEATIREYYDGEGDKDARISIIKAAIEKATERLVEAAYKEGRDDGYDSISATDEYNEKRWQQSRAKAALTTRATADDA